MTEIITRRGLVTGLVSLIAAPAIVRAGSLMPVHALDPEWLSEGAVERLTEGWIVDGQHRHIFTVTYTVTYKIVLVDEAGPKFEGVPCPYPA